MASYRGISSQSPHSSSGHADSAEGTPDTSLTAFSPEDARPPRAPGTSPSGGLSFDGVQHDPFVTTTTAQQSTRVLSATATAFRPLGLGSSPSSITPSIITPPSTSSTTQFGTFSTDTAASRCMKIFGIYDVEVIALVNASIKVMFTPLRIFRSCRYTYITVGTSLMLRLVSR